MRGNLQNVFNSNFFKVPFNIFCSNYIRRFSFVPNKSEGPPKSSVINLLKSKIKMSGPITVYDYMKEALTNPACGYYMIKDVFGKSGDFITSPEITQIFGEMIAVWSLNEWQKLGAPKPFQLVELGPGRGTMMHDILRVFNRLKLPPSDVSIHLVEISEELSKLQVSKLCKSVSSIGVDSTFYKKGRTESGMDVYWHTSIQQLPRQFSCILAHEFFDALPIHILKRNEDRGWLEVLIDIDELDNKLHFVLSKAPTPACIYSKYANGRDYFEFSPQSGVIMEQLAQLLEEYGGFALIVDYGHDGTKGDTFRGFRQHKVVNPLDNPGNCDLTADVDFSFLKTITKDKLISLGPVSQHQFLKQLHIDVRLQMLLRNCSSDKGREDILSGYHMIMDSDKMGECFKVASFFPAVLEEFLKQCPVPGFVK